MSTSKRGAKSTTRKKLSVSKQTVKDLAAKRAKGVKGGRIRTNACAYGGIVQGNW